MATSLETLQAQMAEVDAETTRIAEFIQGLIDQAIAGTITIDQLNEQVQPRLTALRALGQPPTP